MSSSRSSNRKRSTTSSSNNQNQNQNENFVSKSDEEWWEKYLLVLEYKEANGTYDIPVEFNYMTVRGGTIKLGVWLANQRLKLENMSDDRYFYLTQLMETGLLWADTETMGVEKVVSSSHQSQAYHDTQTEFTLEESFASHSSSSNKKTKRSPEFTSSSSSSNQQYHSSSNLMAPPKSRESTTSFATVQHHSKTSSGAMSAKSTSKRESALANVLNHALFQFNPNTQSVTSRLSLPQNTSSFTERSALLDSNWEEERENYNHNRSGVQLSNNSYDDSNTIHVVENEEENTTKRRKYDHTDHTNNNTNTNSFSSTYIKTEQHTYYEPIDLTTTTSSTTNTTSVVTIITNLNNLSYEPNSHSSYIAFAYRERNNNSDPLLIGFGKGRPTNRTRLLWKIEHMMICEVNNVVKKRGNKEVNEEVQQISQSGFSDSSRFFMYCHAVMMSDYAILDTNIHFEIAPFTNSTANGRFPGERFLLSKPSQRRMNEIREILNRDG